MRCAVLFLVATGVGCSVKSPSVVPQVARVMWVAPSGLRLSIEVDVHNPNSFPLVADAIDGVVLLGNGSQLGQGLAYPRGRIPAKGAARLVTQVDVQWLDLKALAPFLLTSGPVPYTFRGHARLGGKGLRVSIPFEMRGELTREQVLRAGLRGL